MFFRETDSAIRSATELEVNPKPYSTSQRANQDIRALNMSYLTKNEGLNNKDNFYGFYTQEGVQHIWNWAKIFTEQEVMNFTSQRFLSPSICESATLEEDSSPKKKRPEPKPIIGVKRSLSAFHKAQDLEKWSRELEDMINFPKPAKPALHLPYLEDPDFTSNQPQEWQPGDLLRDHLDHSEDIQGVLSCTSTQEIRWISLSINIPHMATSTLNALEEFLQIFAQDQRPYYLILRPRSISGRLEDHGHAQKLSRYKIIQVILLKAQIELTASFHGAIKAFSSKTFISIYFLSLSPENLDLSSLLSIESCGILNPPSFHSNSFAKLESDTHPASKAPSQSTSIIN
ncbi:hypothetical protein F2Q68_00031320 [Brassica cretica]|uniref:Uncharacterized protein n=1 Tax=Brassica cretica TaxID=69181 RepID=A0A8S9GGS8_BRACR|nr:hypothetical protein F2Q68_00031320 [Brassica cretica]